jgi:hypothetical protein
MCIFFLVSLRPKSLLPRLKARVRVPEAERHFVKEHVVVVVVVVFVAVVAIAMAILTTL